MARPPAKRQKRLIILSSDDEDEGIEKGLQSLEQSNGSLASTNVITSTVQALPDRSRVKLTARDKTRPIKLSPNTTPTSSPKKRKKKAKTGQQEPKSKSLYTFFTAATQTQRSRAGSELKTPELEEEDYIEDELLDEESRRLADPCLGNNGVLDQRKSKRLSPPHSGHRYGGETFPGGSQRFLRAPRRTQSKAPKDGGGMAFEKNGRPWAEKYAPTNLEELAVHKKKVADVRTWLDNVLQGRDRKRLLILKGPCGTGKTTTLSLLGSAMGFGISEWRNPVGLGLSSEGFVSMSAQFEDFLGRCGRFPSLELFGNTENDNTDTPQPTVGSPSAGGKRVVLVEEFPNTFTRSTAALVSFRSAVLHYLAASTPSLGVLFSGSSHQSEQITPVVMIVSETLLTTTTASADSFTAHRLLGPNILTHPGVSVIEFNPIAPTFITKALDLVVQKEARKSGRRRTPGTAMLKKLGEIGDVRSAIGSLEFLCLRGDESSDWSGRVAGKTKRGTREGSALSKTEKESLEMVTRREASLGIFHAVGKVVYNKRDDVPAPDPNIELPPQPPDHLSQHVRPKTSQVSVEALIDETGTDTQTFIAALHENYILSCEGPSAIESVNSCIDALSDCDLLSPDRRAGFGSGGIGGGSGRGAFQGAATDSLRQDEICFQVAVRGILFALPNPVKRRAPPSSTSGGRTSGKGDAFKMFYPTSLRLWRRAEEIEALVENWINRSGKPEDASETTVTGYDTSTAKPGSVETWKSNFVGDYKPRPIASPSSEEAPNPGVTGGNNARREMILERLPYMAKINRYKPHCSTNLRDLEKITQFRGIEVQSDQVPDDESDLSPLDQWTTDRPAESGHLSQKPVSVSRTSNEDKRREGFGSRLPVGKQAEKLVLSDDDIEDD
ncbi:MAG: Cell cycle checkpoint protein rad17 [Pleopsidium flavum]|nr:MAG: Cell cycle checkpoint protein rad17 [Pleopsidium flavum]